MTKPKTSKLMRLGTNQPTRRARPPPRTPWNTPLMRRRSSTRRNHDSRRSAAGPASPEAQSSQMSHPGKPTQATDPAPEAREGQPRRRTARRGRPRPVSHGMPPVRAGAVCPHMRVPRPPSLPTSAAPRSRTSGFASPQHPAEIRAGVRRLHLPQRPGEPVPGISSRWPVSLRIVLSASPAEACASTNPAGTSVSNLESSSVLADTRRSRRSRTGARANQPAPRPHSRRQVITLSDIISRRVNNISGDSQTARMTSHARP